MCRFFIFTDIKEEIGKPGIYLVVYEATRLVNDEKAIDSCLCHQKRWGRDKRIFFLSAAEQNPKPVKKCINFSELNKLHLFIVTAFLSNTIIPFTKVLLSSDPMIQFGYNRKIKLPFHSLKQCICLSTFNTLYDAGEIKA